MASGCNREECPRKYDALVYVANEGDGTISVIDPEGLEVVKTLDVNTDEMDFSPHNIQVAPSGHQIWVTAPTQSHGGEEEILVLSPRKGKVEKRIAAGEHMHLAHVVLDAAGAFAYVSATDAHEVLKVDAESFEVVQHLPLPSGCGPHGMRMNGSKLFIATLYSPGLVVLDVTTGIVEQVQVGGMGVQTAVTSDGRYAYVSLYDRKQVFRHDALTGDSLRIALPSSSQGPVQLYLSPQDDLLYVCDQGMLNGRPASDKLYVVDAVQGLVVDSVVVGMGAHGVVLSPDGAFAYVTNQQDNSVSVVDLAMGEVVATLPVGAAPNGISYLVCE